MREYDKLTTQFDSCIQKRKKLQTQDRPIDMTHFSVNVNIVPFLFL